MGVPQAIFHGTEDEALELLKAIAHHCACNKPLGVLLGTPCPAHLMLTSGQRELDGLVFAHRNAERLLLEEWLGNSL